MHKKQINQLAQASYTKDNLDAKTVDKIATLLSRADLKQYIRALKLIEKTKKITLVLPNSKLYNKSLVRSKKQVEVLEDPSLLLGAKIIDNDMVYDMTLKNSLQEFAEIA